LKIYDRKENENENENGNEVAFLRQKKLQGFSCVTQKFNFLLEKNF
jgi:hypothetical protein